MYDRDITLVATWRTDGRGHSGDMDTGHDPKYDIDLDLGCGEKWKDWENNYEVEPDSMSEEGEMKER